MIIFKLPDLGEGLPEAEIHEWYVKEGDTVKLDQPLVSMETAKAVVDIPSPVAGRIKKLHGKRGDVIQTDAPLIEFEGTDNHSVQKDTGTVVGVIETSDTLLTGAATGVVVKTRTTNTLKATPAVRMLANNLGIDLHAVQGTGIGGAITIDDVKNASTVHTAHAPSSDALPEKINSVRKFMAQAMSQSHAQVVPVTITEDADIHRWLEKTDVTLRLIQAVIAACKAAPALNAHFHGDTISRKLHEEINLGVAVDTPDGLYAPVIKNVAHQSPEQLRAAINTLKEKAKNQSFSPADLQEATITLSNFGTIVGRYATPIVVPPTVAIIAVGKTRPTVVAWEGKTAVHPVMPLSLTFDHRAATGGEAARFMMAMVESLEKK